MDLYAILKTLHIVSATAWVGGGLLGCALGLMAARSRTEEALLDTIAQLEWSAQHVFVPASIATLVFGLGMTWLGGLWLELWVQIGFGAIVTTIAFGATVLGPRIGRILALREAGQTADAVRLARQVLYAAACDGTILVLAIVDMTLKPGPGDWPLLAGMAAITLAAGLFLLPRAFATPLPPIEAHLEQRS